MNGSRRTPPAASIIPIALFLALLAYLSVAYGPALTRLASKPEEFKSLIASYGSLGVLVFLFFQILQVIVAVIPGEFVQVAGGYIFGTIPGAVYTALGIFLGSAAAFFLARILGGSLLRAIVARKDLERFGFLVNSDKIEVVLFLLFVIPGIPKDILVYIAGITPIGAVRFLLLSTLARFPGQLASTYIGANIQERNYPGVVVVSAIACVLFALGYINKERILARIRRGEKQALAEEGGGNMKAESGEGPFAARVGTWLGHVRALAEGIGPRGSATPGESRGSEYCEGVLRDLGYDPSVDTFPSAGTVFGPHLVAALGMLLSFIVYPLFAPVTAWAGAVLAVVVVGSEVLELALKDNPLRWVLPRRASRNVFATADPAGAAVRDLVLLGHVDTQRTPIIFSSKRWLGIYHALSTAALVSFIAQAALYVAGAFLRLDWAWTASLAVLPFILLLLALTVHAERTPHTPGANDNATAAGLVLTLGEALRAEPLARTRVWLVCTGSEESLHEGARHFFAAHGQELRQPRVINLEMLGCAGPAWLVGEGIVTPLRPSPELLRLAERIAADRPDLGAYPAKLQGGVTEASDAMNAGIPALTLMGMTRDNRAPYWHRMADTFDKMDPAVMGRAYAFAWEMVRRLDAPASLPESPID